MGFVFTKKINKAGQKFLFSITNYTAKVAQLKISNSIFIKKKQFL